MAPYEEAVEWPPILMPLFRCHVARGGLPLSFILAACTLVSNGRGQTPTFTEVAVHDPSVVRYDGTFYVFGSHLASASSADLMKWDQLSSSPTAGNPLAPNPRVEFQEAIAWVGGDNAFWAPDVTRLNDGRFAYYYCIGRLDQPRAALGLAFSSSVTGPYRHDRILLRSGPGGQPPEAGGSYDARLHPNTVDPALFRDREGQLWMVYGSYSGGIFILKIDGNTGLPLARQGYGRRLIGGNHARIEGAYVLYSPESEYYYLFVSFGGLGANEGYNIRLGRSRQPDGPYVDSAGTDLASVAGAPGSLFDDASIAPHGVKLIGGYQFLAVAGEPRVESRGYRSPGHNSAYHDPSTGKHLLVFHTRFVGRGEQHEVRVHQLFLNADDWLVAAPHRYAGETLAPTNAAQIQGNYKIINHGKAITSAVATSVVVSLNADGSITGASVGRWQLSGDCDATLEVAGTTYRGVFMRQWDDDQRAWVRAFSALSADGVALWGSKVAIATAEPPQITSQPLGVQARAGSTVALTVSARGASAYQWRHNGFDVPGATGDTMVLENVSHASAGSYRVVVSGGSDSVTSDPAHLTVLAEGHSRVSNLSVRTALADGRTLIVGFYSKGTKNVLIRGVGPSLASVAPELTGLHPNPRIEFYEGAAQIGLNENWEDSGEPLATVFDAVGAFRLLAGGGDAALRRETVGSRTAHVRGPGAGIVLVEAYDSGGPGELVNVSARNHVGTGAEVMITGFVIAGTVAKTVLIRGIGPKLADFGLPNVLGNPRLQIFNARGERIAENDDWNHAYDDLARRAGAGGLPIPPGGLDSGLVISLNPGAYTAIVSGVGHTTGEALVEVYVMPD
jgi:beta-xylosidase